MIKKCFIGAVCGIIIAAIMVLLLFKAEKITIGVFSLTEYQNYIEKFPSSQTVEPVGTAEEAVAVAQEIWGNAYGKDILFLKSYKVFFDAENKVWLVMEDLPMYMSGGVPYILIEKETGKILAVWHDK